MEGEQQHNPAPENPGNVGGLIAEVENKMSELMAWHEQQVKQLETDKTVLETQAKQQEQAFESQADALRAEIDEQKNSLAQRMQEVEQQRIRLVELTSKLRAEESAMSREWGEVQKEREAVQHQAAEVAKLREKAQERAKAWLETTAAEISEPLKLTTEPEQAHEGEHHHEAA